MPNIYVNVDTLGCNPWEWDDLEVEEGCSASFYGWCQLLFLLGVYSALLLTASNMIGEGAEMLMLVPSLSGLVGSVILPVLGAVPDGAIVLFSGMGPREEVAESLGVGIGALAGSTVMLLTIPWMLSIKAGCVDLDASGEPAYKKPKGAPSEWKKLTPGNDAFLSPKAGVKIGASVRTGATMMLVTLVPFLVVQIPGSFINDPNEDVEARQEKPFAAAGCLMSFGFFVWCASGGESSTTAFLRIVVRIAPPPRARARILSRPLGIAGSSTRRPRRRAPTSTRSSPTSRTPSGSSTSRTAP